MKSSHLKQRFSAGNANSAGENGNTSSIATLDSEIPFCNADLGQVSFHGHNEEVKFFVSVPGWYDVFTILYADVSYSYIASENLMRAHCYTVISLRRNSERLLGMKLVMKTENRKQEA